MAACEGEDRSPVISVGCYNVLCPTYAVKWDEREGKGADGTSNWALRWPAMKAVIGRARWDVVCLQEVEAENAAEVVQGLGDGYAAYYFKHEKRPPDGLLIAVRSDAFEGAVPWEVQHNGVAFGSVNVVHRRSGRKVRIVTAHCRGNNLEQLAALHTFADTRHEGGEAEVTIVTGDFNEDFNPVDGTEVRCPFPETDLGSYTTLVREAELPQVSRPPHKQGEDQKSGKGKVDWIFVRGLRGKCHVELFRDAASRLAVLASHAPCVATGQWPSDHGAEALSIRLLPAAAY